MENNKEQENHDFIYPVQLVNIDRLVNSGL